MWSPEPGSGAARLSRWTALAVSPGRWRAERELRRLRRLPRYQATSTDLPGVRLALIDGASFCSAWDAIFEHGRYDFSCPPAAPRILDCGANIGLAVLRWKQLWPGARISAFEPEPRAFQALLANCRTAGHADVELIEAAVWRQEGQLPLQQEGADASSLLSRPGLGGQVLVRTVRLRDWLREPVDLLKLDVEGAEVDVLLDCADALADVQRVFVEYHSFVDRPQRLEQLVTVLATAGFRLQVQSELAAERPFLERPRDLGMDLRLNLFAFRG